MCQVCAAYAEWAALFRVISVCTVNVEAAGSLPLPSAALVRVTHALPHPPIFCMAVPVNAPVIIIPLPPAAASVVIICVSAALVSTISINLSVMAAVAPVVPIAIVAPAGAPGVTPFLVGVTGGIAVAVPVLRTPAIIGLRNPLERGVCGGLWPPAVLLGLQLQPAAGMLVPVAGGSAMGGGSMSAGGATPRLQLQCAAQEQRPAECTPPSTTAECTAQ